MNRKRGPHSPKILGRVRECAPKVSVPLQVTRGPKAARENGIIIFIVYIFLIIGELRQRTTSAQFMVSSGMTAASPPKFVSLEEIMQAANGMRDMALVHQIVVDEDFRLQKVEPEQNTIQKMVNDTMRKAFWDLLRAELAEDPPNYTQVSF